MLQFQEELALGVKEEQGEEVDSLLVMMLVRTVKKPSKFEDSDTVTAKPARAVFEMPHRTSPRAPKKPAGGGAAVSRVAELEAKLGKAEGQLAEMREQLAAAEKARKDARAALVESKKRFSAAKKRVATAGAASSSAAAEQKPPQAVSDEKCGVISPAGDVPEAAEPGDAQGEETKEMADDDEVNSVTAAIVGDLEGNKGGQEIEQLRTKLMEKDMEVYELKAKLIAMDAEADDLRASLATKGMEIDELRAKLTSKDADIAAVEADNAELMKMAEEASHAVKETATKARDTEHALRESAAREAARVAERLRASERAREALEAELQRGRAQSEQWRKAAEEAAAVLAAVEHGAGAPAADVEWRRHSSGAAAGERVAKDTDEHHVSGGKRNSGGAMRILSELWKKKAQK
ncbi:hypothetical protein OsI_20613 [Oryza sativa Indica Group]|uniref:Uncharacterized protein n=1 Tax=Oryza sativa subsp. indica TaxID=39946 RepID=A2Y6H4_ORYSI|nr:hypothetical protein OsI_20613 [Oryza sativa Indica Group]